MADEGKTQTTQLKSLTVAQDTKHNKSEKNNAASTRKSLQQSTASNSPPLSRKSTDESYKSRAISFLKGISTGSPVIVARSGPAIETLHLVPCDGNNHLKIERTQEEDIQIGRIQAWITSGVIKKSYQHCLDWKFSMPADRPWIDLNIYPGRLVPGQHKEKLNEEFSQSHPFLDPKLTLSKLLNLREDLINHVWKNVDFDPVTLAIGLTCFVRLLNLNLINKTNRKLYASVCIFLAFKFIEEPRLEETKVKKESLLKKLYSMDKYDLLNAKMILDAEFCVYSYLNFSIHLSVDEFRSTYEYIVSRV